MKYSIFFIIFLVNYSRKKNTCLKYLIPIDIIIYHPKRYKNNITLYKQLILIFIALIYNKEIKKDIKNSKRKDKRNDIKLSYNQLFCVLL